MQCDTPSRMADGSHTKITNRLMMEASKYLGGAIFGIILDYHPGTAVQMKKKYDKVMKELLEITVTCRKCGDPVDTRFVIERFKAFGEACERTRNRVKHKGYHTFIRLPRTFYELRRQPLACTARVCLGVPIILPTNVGIH